MAVHVRRVCGRGGVAVRVRGGHVVASWPWPCMIVAAAPVVAVAVRTLDAITAVADHAVAVAPGRRLGCGGRVAFLCRRHVVATRRRMLVFPTVSCLDLRNKIVACILITTARRTAQRGTARPGERRSEPLRFDNSRADAMKIRRMAGQGLTLKDWTAEPLGSRNEWRGVRHGIAPRCLSGLRWP